MKNKIVEIAKEQIADFEEIKISRKDAIKKTGYLAASAATMMILLSSPSQAGPRTSQPAPPPEKRDNGNHGGNGPWK